MSAIGTTTPRIMANGRDGGAAGAEADGRKRKAASASAAAFEAAAKREPRRGMGVAELERIRVGMEMAETFGAYAIVPAPAAMPSHFPPPPPPPPSFFAGVTTAPHHHQHQYVGNGAVQVEYFTPYHRALLQYYNAGALTRFATSNGPAALPHQKNQVDQIHSAVITTAHPALGQPASSESSSSTYHLAQDHRRAQPLQLGQMTKKVAFVDLADSDDDDGGAVEELDLELRL